MLNINKKISKKGFSLIELMVAVAVLALAIFGIFLAFTTGFQGMADARDRTVATNYAQEAMEDIKNIDFDKIEEKVGTTSIPGTKFTKVVIVQPSVNLKTITTQVYWYDRNGTKKWVETDMVVHFIETTAEDPTRIMLYANPYNVLVREIDEDGITVEATDANKSTITAVIKDAKGNTIVDWDKDMIFSLTGSGSLSSITITPDNFDNGKAIVTFTSGIDEGEETITASTEGLTPDSVTINVYDPDVPVKINLTANPYSMLPNITAQSTITAVIANAGGTKVDGTTNEITFSITGPGTLSSPTTKPAVDGKATITLASDGTAGTITVTASAINLVPGVVVVLTGGHITLSASPIEVPNGEESVITVTIKDVNDLPINYDGNINLVMVGNGVGLGNLQPNPVDFDGLTSSEEVTFTATNEGVVEIEAEDANAVFSSDTLTLTVIEELTPHHMIVYAMPLSIPVDGTETSLITAKVMTEDNVRVTSYDEGVTFTTTAGKIIVVDLIFNDGIATAVLDTDSSEAGTATITVCSPSKEICTISGETTVGFFIGPDHIELRADPQNILVGGQNCIVTAKIVDYKGTVISSYNEDIAFNISAGWNDTIKFSTATTAFLTQKFKKGIATVTLISGITAGTAVIDAYSGDISGSLNIPVGITLNLVGGTPAYNFTENSVSFDIMIVGEPLSLEEMQVSWLPNDLETLNKIEIKSPTTADSNIVYDTNIDFPDSPASSGEIINVTDNTLSTGISNVKMYFNSDMAGKNILDVTFNPNSGDYTVHLLP